MLACMLWLVGTELVRKTEAGEGSGKGGRIAPGDDVVDVAAVLEQSPGPWGRVGGELQWVRPVNPVNPG